VSGAAKAAEKGPAAGRLVPAVVEAADEVAGWGAVDRDHPEPRLLP